MSKARRVAAIALMLATVSFFYMLYVPSSPPCKPPPVSVIPKEVPHKPGEVHESKLLPVFTFVDSQNLKLLREIVGSIHVLRHDNFDVHNIIVFTYQLSKREMNEIKLWRNVDPYDLEEDLMMDSVVLDSLRKNNFQATRPPIDLVTLAMMFVLRKYRVALYMKLGQVLTADSLHDLEEQVSHHGFVFLKEDGPILNSDGFVHMNLSVIGLSLDNQNVADAFLLRPIQCLRGFQCDQKQISDLRSRQEQIKPVQTIETIAKASISVSGGDQRFFCGVLLRDDAIFKFHKTEITDVPNAGKPVVAFGMPTLTVQSLEKPIDSATVRIFLPSMLRSISDEEWKSYNFRLYIGYDEGDRFYDDPKAQEEILSSIKKTIGKLPVTVHLVKFSYSKGWVTFLWNGLFVQAISEGADYFYQLNDDCELFEVGWLTAFVGKLKSWNNIGAVGPKDPLHGRMLLTQAFVHKTHFEIFGRLYPQEIKDWYSDDWITQVYGSSRSHQFPMYTIRNHNDKGTRYVHCGQVDLGKFLEVGRRKLKAYEDRQFDLIN